MEIPIESTQEAFQLAKKSGIPTILNPAPAAVLPDELLNLIDIIIPNETEAQILTDLVVDSPESAFEAAKKLQEKGPQTVIVTLGKMGAIYLTGDQQGFIQAEQVNAVDTTGAGDAFVGCLAFQLARKKLLETAIKSACAVATRSVLKIGTQSSFPFYEDVRDLVD